MEKLMLNVVSRDLEGLKCMCRGPIYWNYGYLPQTWEVGKLRRCTKSCEDPTVRHPDLKVKGDNDPLDVVAGRI